MINNLHQQKLGLINAIQTYKSPDRAQFDQFIFALMQKGYLKLIALLTLSNQLSVEESPLLIKHQPLVAVLLLFQL